MQDAPVESFVQTVVVYYDNGNCINVRCSGEVVKQVNARL